MSTRAERQAIELQEVRDFMLSIGLEHCTDTVLNDGLFLSLRLLKDATYKELILACKMPAHQAAHILKNLGVSAPPMDASLDQLLNSIGVVEVAARDVLAYSGLTSIRLLRPMTVIELTAIGLRAVQAQLIVSTLASVDDSGRHPSPDRTSERHAHVAADDTRCVHSGALAQPAALPASAANPTPAAAPLAAAAHVADEGTADESAAEATAEGGAAEGAAEEDAAISLLGAQARAKPNGHRRLVLRVALVILLGALAAGGLWLVLSSAFATARAPPPLASPAAPSPRSKGLDGAVASASQQSPHHNQRGQGKGNTRVLGQGKGNGRGSKRKPGKTKGTGGGALNKRGRNATRIGALSRRRNHNVSVPSASRSTP
jgi:hypothetical protein